MGEDGAVYDATGWSDLVAAGEVCSAASETFARTAVGGPEQQQQKKQQRGGGWVVGQTAQEPAGN